MTTNAMTINLDDANLPTHGPAWEAMVAHVLENADISDLYDDAEIVGYVQEAGIPISEIYDDEEVVAYAKEVVVGAVMTLQELHDMKTQEYLRGTRDEQKARHT